MRKIIYIITLLVFCLLPLQTVLSNSDLDAESLMKKNIGNRQDPNRSSSKKYYEITDEKLKNADPQKLLALLAKYNSNKSYSVRRLALLYTVQIANVHPTEDIRKEVTYRLVSALTAPLDPNANLKPDVYKWLLTFTKDDFNESSKEMLHNALAKNMPDPGVMKICGVADMKEELPRLKELITIDEIQYMNDDSIMRKIWPWYNTRGWTARLARARMGVKEDIIKCIELAESEADVNVRVDRILPNIGYVRQPEAIEYLKKYLESDGYIPPPGQSYASLTVHILSVSLSNFPVKQSSSRNYSQEDIDLCRKWMSEQKEWEIIR
jgi:hypothetical protein